MANSLMIAEIDTDVFFKRQTKTGEENNFKALHCAPIFSKANEVIGILTTYYDDSLYLSEYEIQLKNTVAAELAPILENLIINHSKIILN
jgi:GAF domain-containing protein